MSGPHAARGSDPGTSHAAITNRRVQWGSFRGTALHVHYEARNAVNGLTDYECEMLARQHGGLGACSWKRVGELRTEYDPPLITPVLDQNGHVMTRPGEYGDQRIAYTITSAGRLSYLSMASRKK